MAVAIPHKGRTAAVSQTLQKEEQDQEYKK